MDELVIKIAINFYLCSIIGYIYEVVLGIIKEHKIINPGILKGPWLPIYGFGSVFLTNLRNLKPLKIFLYSFFLTGLFEFICGEFLIIFFKIRLWDYTNCFLNINGLVCFLSAFVFAIGGLISVYLIYPLVEKIYEKCNKKLLKLIVSFLSIGFFLNIIATSHK